MKKKIIIDTDAGHDDAMAIMLALKSNQFDILAITTVCGNSVVENTTRNAHTIMKIIGKNNTPIFSGAKKPLIKPLITATVHGETGLDGVELTDKVPLTNNAVEMIISLIKKNPGEVSLVCIAPLTNIALAIKKDPQTMKKVKEIIIMGGAINVPGNMSSVAEFNIFVDPDAAKIVFNFPVKKILVPLDVCNKVQLILNDFKRISHKKLKNIILKMMKPFISNLRKDLGAKGAIMYDPLPIFFLMKTTNCKIQKCNIQIETKGEITRGMTVVDKRQITDRLKTNVSIVTYISPTQFRNTFVKVLSR